MNAKPQLKWRQPLRFSCQVGAALASFSLSVIAAQSANIVTNGAFESPLVLGTYYDLYDAGQSFGSWSVSGGRVGQLTHQHDPGGSIAAYDGMQCVQLAGIGGTNGGIFQDVPTVAGQSCRISFAFAGNPGTDFPPAVKVMQVIWGGTVVDTLSFDTTGHSYAVPGWTNLTYTLTATGAVTRLQFVNVTPGSSAAGPLVDTVSVDPITDEDLVASIHFSAVDVCWAGRTNQMYQAQYTTDLGGTNWINLGFHVVGSGANCVTDSINGSEKRFYRIARLP